MKKLLRFDIDEEGSAEQSHQKTGEGELRPSTNFAFHFDPPTVGLHQLPGDGQPQPRTTRGPRPRLVGSIEALEDVG